MNGSEFRDALAAMNWTLRGVADTLGVHETRVRRMAKDQHPIPDTLATWLRTLAAVHRRHPLPEGWRGGVPAQD